MNDKIALHECLAALLTETGWQPRNDAQWTRLRDALPDIRALLAAAPEPPAPGVELKAASVDPPAAWRWETKDNEFGWSWNYGPENPRFEEMYADHAAWLRNVQPLYTHATPPAPSAGVSVSEVDWRMKFVAERQLWWGRHSVDRISQAECLELAERDANEIERLTAAQVRANDSGVGN